MNILGVPYHVHASADGGELYVTRHGLPLKDRLASLAWFDPARRAAQWKPLAGATGSVHRVTLDPDAAGGPLHMVVKFCRFGQEVFIGAQASFLKEVPQEVIQGARFNGPFEEFSRVMTLRAAARTRGQVRMHTKRPLAIYCPPRRYPAWKLGRASAELQRCTDFMHRHLRDDDAAPPLHHDRDYLLIYSWIKGESAQSMHLRGAMDEQALRGLSHLTAADMMRCGFRCLDHKPAHIILRPRTPGGAAVWGGAPAYALVDFELLVDHESASNPPAAAPAATPASAPAIVQPDPALCR